MEGNQKRTLLIWGTFLFLLGMLNGFVLPFFTNPRAGLSAHLAGVQGGMVLMIFGLMWNNVRRSKAALNISCWFSIYSIYITWLGLLLSAVWGTHSLIGGAGFRAAGYQEFTVLLLLLTAAIAIVAAVIIILRGLFANDAPSNGRETAR